METTTEATYSLNPARSALVLPTVPAEIDNEAFVLQLAKLNLPDNSDRQGLLTFSRDQLPELAENTVSASDIDLNEFETAMGSLRGVPLHPPTEWVAGRRGNFRSKVEIFDCDPSLGGKSVDSVSTSFSVAPAALGKCVFAPLALNRCSRKRLPQMED